MQRNHIFSFGSVSISVIKLFKKGIRFLGDIRHDVAVYRLLSCLPRNIYYHNLQYKLFGGSRKSDKLLQNGKPTCQVHKSKIFIIIQKYWKIDWCFSTVMKQILHTFTTVATSAMRNKSNFLISHTFKIFSSVQFIWISTVQIFFSLLKIFPTSLRHPVKENKC